MRTSFKSSVNLLILLALFSFSALAEHTLGSRGISGANGRDGYKGRDGISVTLFARGQRQTVNVSGRRGGRGEDGHNGRRASFCFSQHRVRQNVRGADGGHGGRGGNGGAGGDAGNVTIYYTAKIQLRKIRVTALGGRGGRAGRGGYGGHGCQCRIPSWTRRACPPGYKRRIRERRERERRAREAARRKAQQKAQKEAQKKKKDKKTGDGKDKKNKKDNRLADHRHRHNRPGHSPRHHGPIRCPRVVFHCVSGRRGDDGANGRDGRRGSDGTLYLVKGLKKLRPEKRRNDYALDRIPAKPLLLSENLWTRHPGANSVLAPGSAMADSYLKFRKHLVVTYRASWQVPRASAAGFPGNVQLTLDNGVLTRIFPGDVWVHATLTRKGNRYRDIIRDILQTGQLHHYRTKVEGKGEETRLVLEDISPVRNKVTTSLALDIKSKRFIGWKDLFNGRIPDSALSIEGNRYVISLGKLPFNKKFLGPSRRLKLAISVTRGFHGNASTHNLTMDHRTGADEDEEDEGD